MLTAPGTPGGYTNMLREDEYFNDDRKILHTLHRCRVLVTVLRQTYSGWIDEAPPEDRSCFV